MLRRARHAETHRTSKLGWLRAAVLGANDGIVSTASLLMGVAASNAEPKAVLLAGTAGLVSGALSMAAGEYVSVSSQADTERAEVLRERRELEGDPASEHRELEQIYVKRGLSKELAQDVAAQLMKRDALDAHLRDELHMTSDTAARPIAAALASAAAFAVGALVPMLVAVVTPRGATLYAVSGASLLALAAAGAISARVGGAKLWRAVARVTFWGALAMGVTAGVGALFGVAVG